MTVEPAGLLPAGRQFVILGEIAENYGGMTNVVLHRSRAFVREAGAAVQILTTGPNRDHVQVEAEMFADGRMISGMRLRNMFDELRASTEPPTIRPEDEPAGLASSMTREAGYESDFRHGIEITRRQRAPQADLPEQIDHLRPDGSAFLIQRRESTGSGEEKRWVAYLCDAVGRGVIRFSSMAELRFHWLDTVIGQDTAFLLSDSRRVAAYIAGYKRDNVSILQTLHTNHLSKKGGPPIGPLNKSHVSIVSAAADFDAFVFLTQRQKRDFEELVGSEDTYHVIPNSRHEDSQHYRSSLRVAGSGVVLSRLAPEKRVQDAILAVSRCRDRYAWAPDLAIYGEGVARRKLEALIEQESLSERVQLLGYEPEARRNLGRSSFLLLTSQSEGFGLVLVEAMAAGCIPIAYDVKYGPREIIEHGVNGFLVPSGDIDGLVAAIAEIDEMPSERLATMRSAAILRAEVFSDRTVTAQWGEVMRAAINNVHKTRFAAKIQSSMIYVANGTLHLRLTLAVEKELKNAGCQLLFKGRVAPIITKYPTTVSESGSCYVASASVPLSELRWAANDVLDVYLEMRDESGFSQTRVKASDVPHDRPIDCSPQLFEFYATKYGNLSMRPQLQNH
ncbi:glycosyltransferase [Arthrobacter rhombi]|uniref:glycosyltransferase n=1 Tax=Arthrobacter rhombi TaxID=71253 RepID=UPI003FCFE46F